MSYHEAIEDGIPMRSTSSVTLYYPPCRFCGKPVESWTYIRDRRYACPDCRKEAVAQERAEKDGANRTRKEKKLDSAIRRISKVADISKYAKAIERVKTDLYRTGWYQSTEEIMVALEFLRRNVTAYHQVKVHEYSVDFVLPDMKVILEVDGSPFHGKDKIRQQDKRDEVISWKFGSDWEIIHIKTENINENITRLLPAIRAVLANRKKKALKII